MDDTRQADTESALSLKWGDARAKVAVAFQQLEIAMKAEAEAQIRHIYEPKPSRHDLHRFAAYRSGVGAAIYALEDALENEGEAFGKWSSVND